jgi:hypothetical protein
MGRPTKDLTPKPINPLAVIDEQRAHPRKLGGNGGMLFDKDLEDVPFQALSAVTWNMVSDMFNKGTTKEVALLTIRLVDIRACMTSQNEEDWYGPARQAQLSGGYVRQTLRKEEEDWHKYLAHAVFTLTRKHATKETPKYGTPPRHPLELHLYQDTPDEAGYAANPFDEEGA